MIKTFCLAFLGVAAVMLWVAGCVLAAFHANSEVVGLLCMVAALAVPASVAIAVAVKAMK